MTTRDLPDSSFREEILAEPGGEILAACFQCGTCTAGCPVAALEPKYSPRRVVRMVLLGLREEVLNASELWLCSACFTCQERCPQGVRVKDLIEVLRNLAVREGRGHPSLQLQLRALAQHGRLYEIEEFDNKKRQRAGLPPLETKCEAVARLCGESQP